MSRTDAHFQSIAIVGTGLIGTSIALAARRAGIADVTGFDADPAHVDAATQLGALTRPSPDIVTATEHADLIIVATPVSAAASVLEAVAGKGLLTDALSTKRTIARLVAEAGQADRYCGAHPMAGSDQSGPSAARADLFDDAPCHLCPGSASADVVRRVAGFWQSLGCRTTEPMSAQAHDRLVARVSHLPHLTAVALRRVVADDAAHGGQGLRDMTRIAGGDPDLWAGILSDNADEVAAALDALAMQLRDAATTLRTGDSSRLLDALRAGKNAYIEKKQPPSQAAASGSD